MNVDKLVLRKVFDPTEQLQAPLFQRPYVWQEQKNWEPFWEAIKEVAEKKRTDSFDRPHFLGTIVLDQIPNVTGTIARRQIIDGQQRLLTLQVALAVARDICKEAGKDDYENAFRKLTDNDAPLSKTEDDILKVWPTNADQEDFRLVMKAGSAEVVRAMPHSDPEDEWLIPDAYLYFDENFREWLGDLSGQEFDKRIDALYQTFVDGVHVVVIDLEEQDDAQEIFETLNALGTPLLPADLVKNFLFHAAIEQEQDTHDLYQDYWRCFDADRGYWRAEVRQGRLKRPRIDLFLFHYLTLMSGDTVLDTQIFRVFKNFFNEQHEHSAVRHMALFRTYADVYRGFESYTRNSEEELFFYRLEQLDTTTVYPLMLEVCKRHGDADARRERLQVIGDIESFLVRRAICRLTPKNYNRFFADLVKHALSIGDFSASTIRAFLLKQTAETARWPDDNEFKEAWLDLEFYKRLKRSRTRMILEALERAQHSELTEDVEVDRKLTVEHLMPRKWEKHWPLQYDANVDGDRESAARERRKCVHKIGNLSLLTKKLNPTVSNRAWLKKRKKIVDYSALNLKRAFQDLDVWDEAAINNRTADLFEYALKIWPRPAE